MPDNRHTLSVLVENKPGVLSRVSALFTRRGFNILSLAVGQTEHEEISRITVTVQAEPLPFEQVTKQLNKLVNVLKVVDLDKDQSVQRRLILVKVRADDKTRSKILTIVEMFRAHVVDVQPESLVIQGVGETATLEALLDMLEPYGVSELVQSGVVAIGRGARSITDQLKENTRG
ncbi:acetolactate synthase small subunit [Nanchangia anserum]|uniref:Acetolactate synthase small subunit n=1 Tax=Nanchangia anserum TaxID=2692125 RepID=A0A8I0GBU1_9ACTO|nr:acetolactate synthase small subunit [Nanchangia anserum]MBD3689401.1 acetolactate synthase small subunit [Nanchangia anserum]QOX81608.1 acetolactate synthase small subunit [Nanchangia anserum]